MSQVIESTVNSVKALPDKVDTSAVTEPVTKAGRKVYDQVAGGVQWYVERWEDMVYEAKAARAPAQMLSVDEVLAGLSGAKVMSSIPGRARLRLKSLKRQDQVAEQTAQALAGKPGINQAGVNPLTGSVLVLFDKDQYPSLDALLQAIKPSQTSSRSRRSQTPLR